MNIYKDYLKIVFGGIIFLFSLALAYFSAAYFSSEEGMSFLSTLLIFGGAYLLIGIVTVSVLAISLGFLFSADIVILHVLSQGYEAYDQLLKVLILGTVLLVLYFFAWMKTKDVISVDSPK